MKKCERLQFVTRAEWRRWLASNHTQRDGVWLVSWKKHTGKQTISYDEAVSEALAFGWVDSRPAKLDDDRTMLYYCPRRRGSGWSGPNKERIARLRAEGLMAPAGEALIAQAVADGSWTKLDGPTALLVPDDLAAALDSLPAARPKWEAFPPSAKRAILEWIALAKRAETRARRVGETARLAAVGQRANEWVPKDSRANQRAPKAKASTGMNKSAAAGAQKRRMAAAGHVEGPGASLAEGRPKRKR